MPLFDKLDKELSKVETIYPYKDITDEEWAFTYENGEKVPSVDFEWRGVGFVVKRPDMPRINFIEKHSVDLVAVKGLDVPHRRFNPDFIEYVCGVKGKKGLIEDWVGVETEDGQGNVVKKPYDSDWLFLKMKHGGGMFLYTKFMQKYTDLMDMVKDKEKKTEEKEENL